MKGERLLLLSCSQRKRPDPGLLPALERYDGPTYRLLRKHRREGGETPAVWVLSAEHGLIPAEQLIPSYDRRMTPARARALRPQVSATLDALAGEGVTEALVCAGKTYAAALGDVGGHLRCPLAYAGSSMGRQLAVLHDWLYGSPPEVAASPSALPVVFRGRVLDCTAEDVLSLARKRAAGDPAGAARFAGWYVPIDDYRVAPKWLLSELTGARVSTFRTDDALKVLTQLGVEVRRA